MVKFDILNIVIKSIVSFSTLLIFVRMMGKKQISQLTYFDYIVGITIGSIAASFALDDNITYYHGIICMFILACLQILLSLLSIKSINARRILEGTPTILIQNGKIIENNLKKVKLTVNDLLEELRINGIFNIAEVETAILETSGRVSTQLKSYCQTVTIQDLNIQAKYNGICANLIIDGKVMNNNIITIGKDYNWLINELKKQNILSPNDVLLGYLDNDNNLQIDKKNSDPVIKNILY